MLKPPTCPQPLSRVRRHFPTVYPLQDRSTAVVGPARIMAITWITAVAPVVLSVTVMATTVSKRHRTGWIRERSAF
jgi:hypothetical protein